jgi:hypothetical protein
MQRRSPSRHLDARRLRALNKLGNCLVPGDDDLPSFSRCGCSDHVDDILDYLPADDRIALGRILFLLSFVPARTLRCLLMLLEADLPLPNLVAAPLRFLRLGVRGLVLSLYYSGETGLHYHGKNSLNILGYQVRVAKPKKASGSMRPSEPRP